MTRQGLQQREPKKHDQLSNVCSSTDRGDQGGGLENGFEVQFLSQFWNELDLSIGEGRGHMHSHFGSHEKGEIGGGNQGIHTNSRNGRNVVFPHKGRVPASFEPRSFDADQVWANFDDSEIDVMGRGEAPQESKREGRFSSFKPEDRSLTSQRWKRRTNQRGHSSQTDSFRSKQAHTSANEVRTSFSDYKHSGKWNPTRLVCVTRRPFGGQEQKDDDTETTSSRSNTNGGATSAMVPRLSFHRDSRQQEKQKTSPSNKRFVTVDHVKSTTTQDAEPTQRLDTVSRKWAPRRLLGSLEKERHVTRYAESKSTTGTLEIEIPKKKFSPKRLMCSTNSRTFEYEPKAPPAGSNKEDLYLSRFVNSTSSKRSNLGVFKNRIGDAGGIQLSNSVGQVRTSNRVSHQEKMVYEPDMKETRRSPKSSTNATSHSEDWTRSTWSPSHLLCVSTAERMAENHDARSRRSKRTQRDTWYVPPGGVFDLDERHTMDMVFFDTNF